MFLLKCSIAVDFSFSLKRASQHCIEYSLARASRMSRSAASSSSSDGAQTVLVALLWDTRRAEHQTTKLRNGRLLSTHERFALSRQVRNTKGKASFAPRTCCCHGTPSSLHVWLQVARAFRCVGLHLFSNIFHTGSSAYSVVDPSADGRMVGSPVLGMRRTEQLRAGPRRTSTLAKFPEIINSGEPDSPKL